MIARNAAFSSWSARRDAEWRRGGGTSMWYRWVGASALPGPTSRSILVEDGAADVAGVRAVDVVGVGAADVVGVRGADVAGVGAADVVGIGAADVVGVRAVDVAGVRAADVAGVGAADVAGVLSGVSIIAADAGGVGTRIDGS